MIADLLNNGTWKLVDGRFDFGGMSQEEVIAILQEEMQVLAMLTSALSKIVARKAVKQKAWGDVTPVCSDHIDDAQCLNPSRPAPVPDRNAVLDSVILGPLESFSRS